MDNIGSQLTMTEECESPETRHCYSCLLENEEIDLQNYFIQNPTLKAILKMDQLALCYICKKVAKNAEKFINNVERAQTLLKSFKSAKYTFENIKPSFNLTTSEILNNVIEIKAQDPEENDEKVKFEHENDLKDNIDSDLQESFIGMEIKQELNSNSEYFENETDQFDDETLANVINNIEKAIEMKTEPNDLFLNLPKTKGRVKKNRLKNGKKIVKVDKIKKKIKSMKNSIETENMENAGASLIESICLTHAECLEYRVQKSLEPLYQSCEYKCTDCIKGFKFKPSFATHMERHSKVCGDYECDICKLRFGSEEKLNNHCKSHYVRYKCTQCGFQRVCRSSVEDHISTTHENFPRFKCPKCDKLFKRKTAVRKHVYYSHKDKIQCGYCNKDYATRESLKAHLIRRHPTEVSYKKPVKEHVCKECGMAFLRAAELKKHSVKHSDVRNYYCVECDKSFKSQTCLQQHLKTVSVHSSPTDIKHPCPLCSKQFRTKAHANRHLNTVHVKDGSRYSCDQCGKDYSCKYKLAKHIREHEGYERPRNFECSVCKKVFYTKRILDGHLRIHTGEKPYHCPVCPAQFNQYGSLYNHKKLIHKLIGKETTDERTNILPKRGRKKIIDYTCSG